MQLGKLFYKKGKILPLIELLSILHGTLLWKIL